MSANVLPEVWQRCRQEGFNDHIGKPLLPAATACSSRRHGPMQIRHARAVVRTGGKHQAAAANLTLLCC